MVLTLESCLHLSLTSHILTSFNYPFFLLIAPPSLHFLLVCEGVYRLYVCVQVGVYANIMCFSYSVFSLFKKTCSGWLDVVSPFTALFLYSDLFNWSYIQIEPANKDNSVFPLYAIH